MTGVVVEIRKMGVAVSLDVVPVFGQRLQVYRMDSGQELIVGTGAVRKVVGGRVNVNPLETSSFDGARVGDLVRAA